MSSHMKKKTKKQILEEKGRQLAALVSQHALIEKAKRETIIVEFNVTEMSDFVNLILAKTAEKIITLNMAPKYIKIIMPDKILGLEVVKE